MVEAGDGTETLPAPFTFKWLLSRVNSFVGLEAQQPQEALPTHLTRVRFLLSVHPAVDAEVGAAAEAFHTGRASLQCALSEEP